MDYYLASAEDVARELTTSPAGLAAAVAQQRLAEHGPNQLAEAKRNTLWQLLLHQLTDTMILVLLAAAGVSVLVGEANSAYVILAIVILNAGVGFGQAYRADQALAALQKMATQQAQVLRGGLPQTVPAADLVPGDAVLLEAGNVIPADVRFVETHALKVDESSLTGESANVEKTAASLPPATTPSATASTWATAALPSPTAGPRPTWWPPAWAPNWAKSPPSSKPKKWPRRCKSGSARWASDCRPPRWG